MRDDGGSSLNLTTLRVRGAEQVGDPWRDLAAAILLEAIRDAENQREISGRYGRFRARRWLVESSWAARLCSEFGVAHDWVVRWVYSLDPLECEEYPPEVVKSNDRGVLVGKV